MTSASASATSANVLVYSDDAAVRERIRMAVGRRPAADVGPINWVEASTNDEVIELVDAGGIDLLLLDGEAWPAGGMGIARQLKEEKLDDCPLICLVLARKVDRWLATWAQADAELSHPLDPVAAAATVAELLRQRAGELPVRAAR
jgi:DNA-binding response OmpR family regulator